MSLKSEEVKVDTLDTITSTSMTIGANASTISIGTSSSKVNVGNLSNYGYIKPGVLNITDLSYSLTVADLLNYQIIVSGYSSMTTSAVNDNITFTMPTPTAELEGIVYTFRKIRGGVSTTGTNMTFNWPTNSYIANNTSLTTTGQPVNTLSSNPQSIRFTVVGYLGTYYFILT